MRDVLATHRDVGILGVRHRTWMFLLLGLVILQFLFSLRSGGAAASANPMEGSLETYVKSVKTKRVAVVMPLHEDQTAVLKKRFKSWNGKRYPCANRREQHMMDMVFYVGQTARVNIDVIHQHFEESEARKCFKDVKIVNAPHWEDDGTHESEESYFFYRIFENSVVSSNYDVFMYMSPKVWQVKANWADKIYEEAVLSDSFWVKGSAAMATCPLNALTADGDCDGSINLGFPAVVHINTNALYSLGDKEFDALRKRSEKKYPSVGSDVAMFKELVSTDHPLTSKLKRGAQRKTLGVDHRNEFRHHDDDPALSNARSKSGSHHVTSLYWPAHIHRYIYSDFIVNALAGKKRFKKDLQHGLHPNTYLVHQGISE